MTCQAPTPSLRPFHVMSKRTPEEKAAEAVAQGIFTSTDESCVCEYLAEKRALNNISDSRERTLFSFLKAWREFLPVPYDQFSTAHLYPAIRKMRDATKPDGKRRFGQSADAAMTAEIKAFALWLVENGHNTTIDPAKVLKIKTPRANQKTVTANDMLTAEELERMIGACLNSRDRAIVMLFYEAALRPCEIGRLTWDDLCFDQWGVLATVCEKTDRVRSIRCVLSTGYLAAWRNDCPYPPTGGATVFCTLRAGRSGQPLPHMPLTETGLREQLKKIAKRAGVERYYRPYQFRHTRATDLLNDGIPESHVMMITHGGRTGMLRVYSHVTAQDAQRSILEMNGVETPQTQKHRRLKANICPSCQMLNRPTAQYCDGCGRELSEEARANVQDKERYAQESEEYAKLVARLRQDLHLPKT